MPSAEAKVSVVVPTYNRAQYLEECLDSLLAQTLPAAEIIVVNNGSTDHTGMVCARYGDRIRYFEIGQVGKPRAINFALQKALGKYIWIMDDDDAALPDAIERFVEPLESDPACGFSYGSSFFTGSNPSNHRIGEILFEREIPDVSRRGLLIPLMEECFIGGGTLVVRASCYGQVGGYDPDFLRSQDYEVLMRLARQFKGTRVRGGPVLFYRQHDVSGQNATADRFTKSDRINKWLEFDQKIFLRLRDELSLAEFLPPGESLEKKARQAILQRIGIMAEKLLMQEISTDLDELSRTADTSAITDEELAIIWRLISHVPYYQAGSIFDHPEFFRKIRSLARSSIFMRRLRSKIARALLMRYRYFRKSSRITDTILRIYWMYF